MLSTKAIQNKRSSDFTAAYLRLLTGASPEPEDWGAAAELIDAGFATGRVHRESTTAQRSIDLLRDFAPTVQGRIYAQQLQEEMRKRTMGHRAKQALFAVAMYALGILTVTLREIATEAAKAILGM